jgi:PIN domain nuclease of toxin-antitoxin system
VETSRQAGLTVLDASALLSLLLGEPASADVQTLIRRRPPPLISAVNLGEVIDRLMRLGGDAEQVNDKIDLLMVGGLEVQPFWLPDARTAAAIRARFYHRTRLPVSLADCACIATALRQHAELATTDAALGLVARQLGVSVIAL